MRPVDRVEPSGERPVVEGLQQAVHLEVGEFAKIGKRAGELGDPAVDAAEASNDVHALIDQRVEIDRPSLRVCR